ncbi:MAG: hypothetical protein JWQ49_3366 [Edaphobacter sp.]|nr:hypothetical protein [Edaphobacter sp.]
MASSKSIVRAGASLICAIALCVFGFLTIPYRIGELILLPGFLALGAKYVFGGPALVIAGLLDSFFYALIIFAIISLWNRFLGDKKEVV